MTYLAVFESDTWRLEREALARALASDWPQAQVKLASSGAGGSEVRDVEWIYRSELGELEGYAHADGQGLYLEGPIEIVADFVVWYRGLVPIEEQIVFCDDSYSFNGVVPPNASKGDIVAIAE
ncbi:hypothetical protein TU94_25855 [Streptomyces cyaneogriseus subsp. noncyanogenus]|uniref:Uncharacterized protein n=1 Tax=Streptomyces cyaneogriseus subsp. noncyanogenus TaxID=477245 RepID=A0A0C5FWD8_9ACTN|nr:hypothetical protein [Streptomyces cyaneogriseus]AJP04377.1 hypothetical protein TU94_25855 [Streptomyces cyaneogriseus subsp. noncyanogenus]